MSCLVKAIFLDRDGVLNRKASDGDYIRNASRFEWLPNTLDALSRLHKAGYKLVIVTNQRGVARGLVSSEDLEEIHQVMRADIAKARIEMAGIYVCPHDELVGCICRKPKPGMLLQAAFDHQIDLSLSWMIGDSSCDVEAGRRAGCRTALIGGYDTVAADLVVGSLSEAASAILAMN